jgi:hypothetical protein
MFLSELGVADAVTLYTFYAVKNPHFPYPHWSEYNASLKRRGSGVVRVSPEAVENSCETDEKTDTHYRLDG